MQNVKDAVLLKQVGLQIRELRKQKNLSQVQLAALMNNHAEHLGRIERGELNVTVCTLKIIAESLETKLKDLLDIDTN